MTCMERNAAKQEEGSGAPQVMQRNQATWNSVRRTHRCTDRRTEGRHMAAQVAHQVDEPHDVLVDVPSIRA